MSRAGKRRRDRSIVAEYGKGKLTQREIAERFGLSPGRVSAILGEYGARDRAKVRAVLSRRMVERWESGRFEGVAVGRSPVWPDCPPDLKPDYKRLQRYVPAAEARAMLERRAAA